MKHKYYKCNGKCADEYTCQFCSGGLAYCIVCHGFEGSLPKTCPGFIMDQDLQDEVYNHGLDFERNKWGYKNGRINTTFGLIRHLDVLDENKRIALLNEVLIEFCKDCGMKTPKWLGQHNCKKSNG